jgi:hypothetical protein
LDKATQDGQDGHWLAILTILATTLVGGRGALLAFHADAQPHELQAFMTAQK